MKVLVTGANGFVGRHLTTFFESAGHQVVPMKGPDEGGPDIRELDAMAAQVKRSAPDAVVHLAGFASVAKSHQAPVEAFSVTALGTVSVLEAVKREAPKATVLAVGSGEVYGRVAQGQRAAESTALLPTSPYGAAKVALEVAAQQYVRGYGLKVIVARPFNHLGLGQHPTFFLPSFAAQVKAKATVIEVGDLTPVRDFSHVDDVVRAYLLLLERGVPGEAYNICSGEHATVRDVLDELLKRASSSAKVHVDPARLRPVEIPWLVGDPSKLEALGWSRQKSWRDAVEEVLR